MTKTKKINWRLGKLPTPEEVMSLIGCKIITQDEARTMFFNETEENERDVESLKSEIKFLRELTVKLSSTQKEIIRVIDIYAPKYQKYDWYQPYISWGNSSPNWASDKLLCSSSSSMSVSSAITSDSFSEIKTF